jgi:hypothetical protein
MNPNDLMRARFRELDPAREAELSDEQRAEIARRIRSEGPTLIRRARQHAMWRRVGSAGLAAAAAAVVIALYPSVRTPERSTVAVVPPTILPACAKDAAMPMSTFTSEQDGRQVLELGRARAVAEADSVITIASLRPCEAVFALTKGTLTVHARDLGGGELKVLAGEQQIVVRGTLFRVEAQAGRVRVAVEHGRVTVQRGASTVATLEAAKAARVDGREAELSRLSPEEMETLRAAVMSEPARAAGHAATEPARDDDKHERRTRSRPEAKAAPSQSAEELFAQAEALWRKGEKKAARILYRKAGRSETPIAETAWLRLSRLELEQDDAQRALSALAGYKQQLRSKELGAEAAWLEVEALSLAGRYRESEHAAERLVRQYPTSPQASAARRLLQTTVKP